MLLKFLRLFSRFRDLESIEVDQVELAATKRALAEIAEENQKLQDRLDDCIHDRAQMWGLLNRSIEAMQTSYQAHVNLTWQRQNGGIPYPDAPHLPQQPAVGEELPANTYGRRSRVSSSELIAARTQSYLKQHLEQQFDAQQQ